MSEDDGRIVELAQAELPKDQSNCLLFRLSVDACGRKGCAALSNGT